MENIIFYISKDDNNWIDIEREWDGIRYLKCVGLEAIGKPKNKYTESFADANELKVYEGDEITNEPTDVTFTFLFIGDNRQKAYSNFYEFIKKGKIYYYDTKRKKKALLVLLDAIAPAVDEYKGSTPYMKADFKFKNIWGKCLNVNNL